MGLPTSVLEINEVETEVDIESRPTTDQGITIGYGILCFLFPIVGWILGAVWKTQFPKKAKSANKLGCWGFVFNFAISLILNSGI